LLVGLAAPGCGSSQARPRVQPAQQTFLPYGAEDARLFDDYIEAAAVGLADVAVRPSADVALRGRTQAAEFVGRVRVSTVSVDSAGGRPIYHVSFSVTERLVGDAIADDHLELAVRPDSPSFGIVKWLDTGMIGRTFVGFFRRYAGADEPLLRFHLSPDTPEVAAAVTLAKALREVRGK